MDLMCIFMYIHLKSYKTTRSHFGSSVTSWLKPDVGAFGLGAASKRIVRFRIDNSHHRSIVARGALAMAVDVHLRGEHEGEAYSHQTCKPSF